jgi:hypothetical protein
MFTEEQKKLTKEFLESVVKGDLTVLDTKRLGICHNLSQILNSRNSYTFVTDNCSDWEHFSGTRPRPIPNVSVTSYYPEDVLWYGKQLELRQSLCSHLLTKLD